MFQLQIVEIKNSIDVFSLIVKSFSAGHLSGEAYIM